MANNKFFFDRDITKSKAFRSLGKTSILVYLDFRMKCKVKKMKARSGRKAEWIILNNGEIEYTYSEAESKGISRPAFKRSLKDLVEKGFIDISHSGMGGPKGDKSKYKISERWTDWGTDDFIFKTMEKDTRQGRGFAAYWRNQKAIIGNAGVTPPSNKNVTPLGDRRGNEVKESLLH